MSKHSKRDILIHFDEETNEIILYTVSVDDTNNIREKEFDGARLDLPFFLKKTADEAEKSLGEIIFSLIDTFSFKKTGIRPYEAINKERHKQDVAEWETAAKSGDPEAQYMLFMEYHSRALINNDSESLVKAEQMLDSSAAKGYSNAVKSKKHWPLMRAAIEKKLKRRPQA
ncbi:hypothetical protein [Gynuella sp.]|uniref:hypothetical protein n=1 Tax=Gynuella sp. TaxID=2969146 RepID=UPI003D0E8508